MSKVILILGHINSGKSTISKYILNSYFNVNKFALGDAVKIFVSDLFNTLHDINPNISNISLNSLYDRSTKENYRDYLQRISTDVVRKHIGENVWVNMVINQIDQVLDYSKIIIVDDVRFKNELNTFKNKYPNLITIRVTRPGYETQSDHISEHDLDNYIPDYTIINSNSLDYLYNEVDNILKKVL